MSADAKPAAAQIVNGGHRRIQIADWRPHEKNTRKGFFTAILPSGLVLHDLMLHERNGSRWIAFPAKEWVNAAGEKQFSRFVAFASRDVADKFRDAILAALDRHLAEGRP